DRYLLTVTSRLDGSSRLAQGQKYGVFPSVAFAWRLSEEGFIQRANLFSDLKLRLSYGRTGNTAIAPYQTLGSLHRTMYSFGDHAAHVGQEPESDRESVERPAGRRGQRVVRRLPHPGLLRLQVRRHLAAPGLARSEAIQAGPRPDPGRGREWRRPDQPGQQGDS